ncbi:MAG: ABC transporter permease [Lachnospiraceae bacterium]|jgi:ribose/xylose/arabinose/galactoside ABC-type transport system permease subunit|nr:ABC transporter permease [Lachnospiraceae bacterium]
MSKKRETSIVNFMSQNMMLCILLVMIAVFSIVAKGFLSVGNLLGILRSVSITGVIAFGMTMVIICGEIDLSVGSSIGLSSVIVAKVAGSLDAAGFMPLESSVIIAMVVAVAIGAVIGWVNGKIRTRFNIPTFIITLAMLNGLYGLAAILSNGFPITTLPSWYGVIGAGVLGKIPVPAIWLVLVFGISLVVMNYTRFGREVYAVGGNMEAARLSGINVNRVKVIVLIIVQVMAALSGIILSSQVYSGSFSFGRGYEMDVIAPVIIGGASLNGGLGKVTGTMIGIVFLGVLMNGMTLLGVDDYVKYVVKGLVVLVAVLVNAIQDELAKKSQ